MIISRLIDAYHQRFVLKHQQKPVVNGAKDGATFKRLLGSQTEPEILACLDRFFASDDPFIAKAGHTVGVFASQYNKLLTGTNSQGATAARRARSRDAFPREELEARMRAREEP